jgi:hypothetical protein
MARPVKTEYKAESLDSFFRTVGKIRTEWEFEPDDNARPWFRGHQRKHWKLIPSIFRIGKFDRETEDEIREEFAIRAPALNSAEALPARDNNWDFYFLMQHYGAPTRLLDWTESPAIALYFAVRDNPGYYDSCVWALDAYSLNERVLGRREVFAPSAPGANPKDAEKVTPWLPERWTKKSIPPEPVAIFPTHIARRISNQKSCFTVHGRKNAAFNRFFGGRSPCLMRIVIPAKLLEEYSMNFKTMVSMKRQFSPTLRGSAGRLQPRIVIQSRTSLIRVFTQGSDHQNGAGRASAYLRSRESPKIPKSLLARMRRFAGRMLRRFPNQVPRVLFTMSSQSSQNEAMDALYLSTD